MLILWLIAGAVIGATLGLIGAGGSVLAVPALVYLADLDPQTATTTSLLIVGSTALIGSRPHAKQGRVDWQVAGVVAAMGVAGAAVGSWLNHHIDGALLLTLFGGAMLLAARSMWRPVQGSDLPQCACSGRDLVTRILPVGLTVGLMTGFFGIGGGFIIVPLLVLGVRMPMRSAVGTSLVVIAASSAVALAFHLSRGSLDLPVAAAFLAAAAAGAWIAGHGSHRFSEVSLRRGFAIALAPLALAVIVDGVRQLAA